MAVAYPSYFLSASAPCKPKTYYNRFPALHSSFQRQFQATCWLIKKECSCSLYVRPFDASRNYLPKISCAMNMSAGQWNGNLTIKFGNLADKARKLWDASPQQVKSFPWMKALKNFIQLVLHLVAALVKFLFVPVFAISSISEMSYCAHEKKLVLVPFLVIFGITAAGVLKETVLDMSPRLQIPQGIEDESSAELYERRSLNQYRFILRQPGKMIQTGRKGLIVIRCRQWTPDVFVKLGGLSSLLKGNTG